MIKHVIIENLEDASGIEIMVRPACLTDQALKYGSVTNFHQASLMLEILVIAIAVGVLALLMAKHGRRRRGMGRYVKGNVDEDFALGTLAANTAILESSDVVGERTRITSLDCIYALADFTQADNSGPIEVGFAHSDYSLAEIEEFLELTTSWNEGDLIDKEVSSRLIRRVGIFHQETSGGNSVLNEGRSIKTKLNWILNAGQGLNFWCYNQGGVAVGTTDPNCHIVGHANLFPT